MSRTRAVVALAGLLGATLLITGAQSVFATPNGNGGDHKEFGIADVPGGATPLYPGASGSRRIRLTDLQNFAILVQTVRTTVASPVDGTGHPVPGCPAGTVFVDSLAGAVTVPANGTADVVLTTHMRASAPDACRNLTFPLTYSGTATKP